MRDSILNIHIIYVYHASTTLKDIDGQTNIAKQLKLNCRYSRAQLETDKISNVVENRLALFNSGPLQILNNTSMTNSTGLSTIEIIYND